MKTLTRILIISLTAILAISCHFNFKVKSSYEEELITITDGDTVRSGFQFSYNSEDEADFPLKLAEIAQTDKDPEVRKLAVSKITFGPSLTDIAKTDKDHEVRKAAIERLAGL